jgi:hypothetical protein
MTETKVRPIADRLRSRTGASASRSSISKRLIVFSVSRQDRLESFFLSSAVIFDEAGRGITDGQSEEALLMLDSVCPLSLLRRFEPGYLG